MNETETHACETCGTEFEQPKRYTCPPDKCDECHDREMIDRLRLCLDRDYDGSFSRADALERLKHEYGQMPIVDHDGSLITELTVETMPGREKWVERITKYTECPECGYDKMYYSYQSNAGHHIIRVHDCARCGHYKNTA
jgi:hypothetical protein